MDRSRNIVREMWARQGIGDADVDYERWGRARVSLMQMAALSRSSIFAVDVYKGVYDYASDGFADLFGIQPALLRNISEQGDMIEDLIHPDDSEKIADLQHALRRRHPRHAPADTDSPG